VSHNLRARAMWRTVATWMSVSSRDAEPWACAGLSLLVLAVVVDSGRARSGERSGRTVRPCGVPDSYSPGSPSAF
jgi:hypothetical protein